MEPKRIRHACSRCRRQKLRCDYERPCPLCVRAGAECIEATERTWRSNRPKSAVYQARHGGQAPEQPERRVRRPSAHVQTRASVRRQETSPTTASVTADTIHAAAVPGSTSSPATHAEQEVAVAPDQRASALHLVGKIFQKYHVAASSRTREVDALPSSDSPQDGSAAVQSELVLVSDLIGIELPPLDVINALLDSYRDSVHWYIRVLHEPLLRARLQVIGETGLASRQQRPLLLLALIVLVLGAQFISDDVREQRCQGVDLASFSVRLVEAAERWYLPSMDYITVETVAYSFLLGTYYLWNRQTRAAYITTGTTIRAAQSIGLNNETHWGNIDPLEQEARRCVWWCVFIGAGFISMSWGTPPMLSEADCNVMHPRDVEDTMEQCPGYGSLEQREDGEIRPVTVGSYNRYKAEMYKIAVSIMRQVYFQPHHGPEELVRLISNLHQRLLAWERSIPQELRVESHPHVASGDSREASLQRMFAIQALTLRVSYDNVQIFLFRPLITIGGVPRSRVPTRENSPAPATRGTSMESVPSSFIKMAQQQCWTSATRTSMAAQRPDLLRLFQFGFPAIHVGVHAFSAGVMLGLLALLAPLSARGQESKRGMARIIQIPRTSTLRSHVWSQMTQVLTDLMHVIAAEETKALIANPAALEFSDTPAKPDVFGEPPDHYPEVTRSSQESGSSDPGALITVSESDLASGDFLEGNMRHCDRTSGLADNAIPVMSSSTAGQDHENAEMFDMSDFWAPPQAGWGEGGHMQGMDQSWMWDWSFPYQ